MYFYTGLKYSIVYFNKKITQGISYIRCSTAPKVFVTFVVLVFLKQYITHVKSNESAGS